MNYVNELYQETSTKMYTPFKSDLINNMGHMCISGTETASVILSKNRSFKSWKVMSLKCRDKLKTKGMVS